MQAWGRKSWGWGLGIVFGNKKAIGDLPSCGEEQVVTVECRFRSQATRVWILVLPLAYLWYCAVTYFSVSHFPYVNSGENSTISQGRSDTTRHLEFLEQYVANSKRSLSVCCHQYEYSELKNSHACWRSPKMVALHGRQFGVRLLSQESCLWNLTAKTKGLRERSYLHVLFISVLNRILFSNLVEGLVLKNRLNEMDQILEEKLYQPLIIH